MSLFVVLPQEIIRMLVLLGITDYVVTECLRSNSLTFCGQQPQHARFSETFYLFLSSSSWCFCVPECGHLCDLLQVLHRQPCSVFGLCLRVALQKGHVRGLFQHLSCVESCARGECFHISKLSDILLSIAPGSSPISVLLGPANVVGRCSSFRVQPLSWRPSTALVA